MTTTPWSVEHLVQWAHTVGVSSDQVLATPEAVRQYLNELPHDQIPEGAYDAVVKFRHLRQDARLAKVRSCMGLTQRAVKAVQERSHTVTRKMLEGCLQELLRAAESRAPRQGDLVETSGLYEREKAREEFQAIALKVRDALVRLPL